MAKRNNTIAAPNEDSLRMIEQLPDKTELSGIYRTPGGNWEGELISEEERIKRRDSSLDNISLGIRKRFISVGLLATAPLALLAIIVAIGMIFLRALDDSPNGPILAAPAIIFGFAWCFAAIYFYRQYFKLFYNYAVRGSVFLIAQLVITGLLVQTLYMLFLKDLPIDMVYIISLTAGIGLLFSPLVSLPLLITWTSTKISANTKVLVLGVLFVASLFASFAVTFF